MPSPSPFSARYSLTQRPRAEAVVSPGRWLGLVAVQDLLHQLLSREAGAAVPVAASPLDAMNCRKRGGDRDVSQTATQTSGRRIGAHHLTSSLYWHCKGETASCSLTTRSTDMGGATCLRDR